MSLTRETIVEHLQQLLAPAQVITDEAELDIVRWHHQPESGEAQERTLQLRLLLSMADVFVAMMAARNYGILG